MKLKAVPNLLKETFNGFFEDAVLRLSAALAYYSIFSLAPLLVIVISVAGFFMGEDAVRRQIEQQLTEMLGPRGTQAIVSMIGAQKQGASLAATIIGLVVLLFGASGVFGQLQDSLNVIWGVQLKPGRGFWHMVKNRFLSFAMVLGIGFLLLISMVITTILSALTGALGDVFPMPGFMVHLVNLIVSFLVITLLFAMIFKVLPDARVKWRNVWAGAVFTAALFTAGKYLLAFYLGRAATSSSYGAAGSLVVVLLWIYYSSIILFFGAEFTKVYSKARGSRITPAPGAIGVAPDVRAEQGMPTKKQLRYATKKAEEGAGLASGPEPVALSHPRKMPRQIFDQAVAEAEWSSIAKSSKIIAQKPWPYVGFALGLGLATGWLVKRDFSHHRGLFSRDLVK